MGVFKNIVEPAVLVSIFTLGTLANRRRRLPPSLNYNTRKPSARSIKTQPFSPTPPSRRPRNSSFRSNFTSRLLATFPFLIEIWYWLLLYWPYQLARAYSARLIYDDPSIFNLAEENAASILDLESMLGIAIERSLQRAILAHAPWIMKVFKKVYIFHIMVGVAFFVYAYTYMPPRAFVRVRRTIAIDNWIAFIIFTLWRCAPPRLMPLEYGYIDILHRRRQQIAATISQSSVPGNSIPKQPFSWSNNQYQLTIAAMPSLHFGTSLLIAVCLIRFSPHRVLRLLAPVWPAAMLLTILATANHWLLDAVVGAMIPCMAWRLHWLLEAPLLGTMEEWGFWLLRTEKPDTAVEYENRRREGMYHGEPGV
ncbi:hypothetical protein EJ04DRAFT_486425 [Polyplosphaeria fusca]|uniref:Inositolphosphotransferase Aur1/Ipt1 domain-containing protein n=1 Tax=Polyplosphaeria fusca TaxID=682080 RepID=A0A9P4V3G9_9PLEO|nr:hypothetical protein EJ04DRAFT_486425 [Polyplosphaeria fusca]